MFVHSCSKVIEFCFQAWKSDTYVSWNNLNKLYELIWSVLLCTPWIWWLPKIGQVRKMHCENNIQVSQSNEIPVSFQLSYIAPRNATKIYLRVVRRWDRDGGSSACIRLGWKVWVFHTLDISTSTVSNILKRHRLKPDDVKYPHRSGLRISTPRENRRLKRLAIRIRRASSMQLQRLWGIRASAVTVHMWLNKIHLNSITIKQ